MSLAITFVVLVFAFAVFLFAVSLVAQGYLYNQPADRLPLRSLAGAVLAAAFLVLWIYLNTRASTPDKYSTLFEFNSTASVPLEDFTAVRLLTVKGPDGKYREMTAKFSKLQRGYFENGDSGRPFKLTSADWLVKAVEVPEGEKTARFEAELFVPDESKPGEFRPWKADDAAMPTFSRDAARIFREVNGRRYIEFVQGTPGPMQIPNRGAWVGAMLLNVLHFVVWFIVFWPILRYSSGTALGLAALMTFMVVLLAMPVLFDRNRLPRPPPVLPAEVAPAKPA